MNQPTLRPVTPSQIDAFAGDGFVVVARVLSAESLLGLADACSRVLSSRHVRDVTAEAQESRSGGHFFVSFNTARREPAVLAAALAGTVGQIAAAVMGSSTARFCDDVLLVKEAGCQTHTEWHDDDPFSLATGPQRCSVWVPLDDVSAEAGALRYLKGSHLRFAGWRQSASDAETLAAAHASDVVVCPVVRGDVVVHHPATIHAAGPNRTPNSRRAFAFRFAGDSARFVLPPARRESRDHYKLNDGDPLAGSCFPLAWPATAIVQEAF